MYNFKFNDNSLTDHLEIDGYQIAGIVLEGININIKIDDNKKIIAYFKDEDINFINSINYEAILLEASNLAIDYISNKDFSIFNSMNHLIITDIVNLEKHSFYHTPVQKISPEETTSHYIKAMSPEDILNNVKPPPDSDYKF